MASTSVSPPKFSQAASCSSTNGGDDSLKDNKELERIIEEVENMAVQLTWMAYDMVALRINPELIESMQKLKDASQRCEAAILGDQQPETNECTNAIQ